MAFRMSPLSAMGVGLLLVTACDSSGATTAATTVQTHASNVSLPETTDSTDHDSLAQAAFDETCPDVRSPATGQWRSDSCKLQIDADTSGYSVTVDEGADLAKAAKVLRALGASSGCWSDQDVDRMSQTIEAGKPLSQIATNGRTEWTFVSGNLIVLCSVG